MPLPQLSPQEVRLGRFAASCSALYALAGLFFAAFPAWTFQAAMGGEAALTPEVRFWQVMGVSMMAAISVACAVVAHSPRERRIALVETLGAVNGFGLRMELMPLHECSSSLAISLNSLMKMSKRTPYNSKPEIWSNSGENKGAWKNGASKAKQQSCFETDSQKVKASARVATSCMERSGARGVESSAVSAADCRGASHAGAHSSQKRMRRSHAQSC